MSLKVWLPLLGNLDNQGTSSINIVNAGGVSSNNSGKIGLCMSFNNSATGYLQMPPILSANLECSIACWVKFNSISANLNLYSLRVGTNASGYTIFMISGNPATIRWDEGASMSSTAVITANTWHHIVCCRNATTKYIYINGVLSNYAAANTLTASNINSNYSLIGGSLNNTAGEVPNANFLNGYLNDFRIYDHCLSAEEVRDLANGLVLHYKLDATSCITPNLLLNSAAVKTGNSAEAHLLYYYFDFTGNLPTGTYTFSFDIKSSNGTESCYTSYANGSSTINRIATLTNIPAEWTHYSYTFTSTSANCNDVFFTSYTAYGKPTNNNNIGYIYVRNVKLEYGEVETPYSCAESEGAVSTIIDSSGYKYDGISDNTVILFTTPNTSKYSAALTAKTGGDILNTSSIIPTTITTDNKYSLSIWVNTTSTEGRWIVKLGNGALNCRGLWLTAALKPLFAYLGSGAFTASDAVNDGNWHHICFTVDGTTSLCYIDGVVCGSSTSTKTDTLTVNLIDVRMDTETILSDCRIYCTPLLDNEVKKLYNIGMGIDKDGNIHTYELDEFLDNGLAKTGVLYSNNCEYLQLDDGSWWRLMLYHEVQLGTHLFTLSNATYCNEEGLFSRLKDIDVYTYNGLYEFYVILDGKEFRWTLTSAPTASNIAGRTNVEGYNACGVGLAKGSNNTQAYLGYGNWWGACGSWTSYTTEGITGIPGFGTTDRICTDYLLLYARVDNPTAQFENYNKYATQIIER